MQFMEKSTRYLLEYEISAQIVFETNNKPIYNGFIF